MAEQQPPVAGTIGARGVNTGLPPVWLIYIYVENLDTSVEACRASGGQLVAGPKSMESHGRYAVIRDPAGAYAALFEAAPRQPDAAIA